VWPEEAYPTLPQQLENLILNPSFEYDTLATSTPKSWAFPTPGMTLHVSNEWAAVGTKSFKVKTPNNATEYGMFMEHFATGTPVEAGSVYNFQATFNVLELTNERHIFAIIKFYNAKEEHVGTEHFTKHITTTGVHTIKASVTAPEEAVTAEVTPFYIQGDGVAEFYIDKIYFGEGPAYFDGDTAGYHWTGTHGDSRSITTPRPGTPPKAKFKVENKGEVIKFTDESINGVGAIVNREWTFGDGDRIITNDEVVEHTYTKAGVYSVTLQVVDRHGRLNSKVEEVEAT
jgi:PKD repeat protein